MVARDDAWDEVIALAERHEAPVWVSPFASRNSFPENHRLFAGFLAASREKIVKCLEGYDLVLVLGAPVFTYHHEGSGPHAPPGVKLFQIVDDPTSAASAPVGVSVISSLKWAISDLLAGPAPLRRGPPSARLQANSVGRGVLSDKYLLQRIAALRPVGSIIVEEAPSSRPALHDFLPIVERDSFYTGASGGLGFGLPASVGVALGRPGRRIVAILGDGSSMYAIQGIWTAVQLELPIAFVIFVNRRYEAIDQFSKFFGMKGFAGAELPGLNFCELARGQGCDAIQVTDAIELDEALIRAFSSKRPVLVSVEVH
jgi:benzoylformate decarboxylase